MWIEKQVTWLVEPKERAKAEGGRRGCFMQGLACQPQNLEKVSHLRVLISKRVAWKGLLEKD